ncbi:acr-5 [Pristionchus pacificus]|uniref:Acr-5 n=1 Tax=Pristionchus pacificus TaxID=54126 RepID=A0A2A6BB09_PRIPA|nr:acr-5 [Pristionchus pacificus]|eukprot:PDM63057.1 acr-5 [Pristionchus pacificus]
MLIRMLLSLFILQRAVAIQPKRGEKIVMSSSTSTFATWLSTNSAPAASTKPSDAEMQRLLEEERRRKAYNEGEERRMKEYIETVRSRSSREEFGSLPEDQSLNWQKRLIDDLFDPEFYERNVHPVVRDHTKPVRINVSMSLYQILEVDEHSQSLSVNVWMVQDWYDEFLDWNPEQYGLLNKTIVPHQQLWIPDTYLYNSETLEQKKTESLMNAIVSTGHWANDSLGARVQLLFPAIYRLSCKMNVRFFPYDQQNCTFIISSWTHDKSSIDYWPKMDEVNLKNMVRNDEWEVLSFNFVRREVYYKCCKEPWVMLYAQLVIKRKPLYYIVNLVIPTSIITIVAVTGFFTPTSSSSERDEKLYLGINTLLTMSIMMLMVCNQMPSTSTYVPLMSWYYIGIIFVIVTGTLMATLVLAIHAQKQYNRPLSKGVRRLVHNWFINNCILEVPTSLIELWMEYGIVDATRSSSNELDPIFKGSIDPVSQMPPDPTRFFRTVSMDMSNSSVYSYERRLASITQQYTMHLKQKQSERKIVRNVSNAREVKRQKLMRSDATDMEQDFIAAIMPLTTLKKLCALEWEYLANVLDRILLTVFSSITLVFFSVLVFFDYIHHHFE